MKTSLIYFFLFLFPNALISTINPGIDINKKQVARHAAKSMPEATDDAWLNKKKIAFNHTSFTPVAPAGTGIISVTPAAIYDNDVRGGAQGINRTVTITNSGPGPLTVSAIALGGANPDQFVLSGLPALPAVIAAGGTASFLVAFNPASAVISAASVNISSDDAATPVFTIPLRGLGTDGLGGANEPSLQEILNLYEIQVNVGDDDITTNVINSDTALRKAPLLGDEVSIQKFQKAGAGNVTITPLAVFGPTANNPVTAMGWYISGNVSLSTELLTVSNSPASNGQTVNVNAAGSFSFDPVADTFGFYSRWPFFSNRRLNSEDALNTFSGSIPHHVRVYPYKKNGTVTANAYIVAFEEDVSGFDYQDLIFVVQNVKPAPPLSNPLLFVENMDNFPNNDNLVFSRVQAPWSRDGVLYNANHDSVNIRIHNKGINPLIITGLSVSNDTTWKIEKFNGAPYVAGAGLPVSILSGTYVDLSLRFIAKNQGTRVVILKEALTITSNDNINPSKKVILHGLWQKQGEGNNEPYAQELLNVFGFKTVTGFTHTDPDKGDSTKLKGDEIKPSYFVRVNPAIPITVRQMSAYHGCCSFTETFRWYEKDSTTLHGVFTHITNDGQSVLPRKSLSGTPASGNMNPPGAFGIKIGSTDFTDANKNPGKKIGVRVWKVLDSSGNIIPNTVIVSNDYLGTSVTNYDYEDNMYYITNIRPQVGTAYFSELGVGPSDLDFGEYQLLTSGSMPLTVTNLGQSYSNGTQDPPLTISSIAITGENKSEFSATLAAPLTLNPQQGSSITVNFNPVTEGLKIADLLIYYNNSLSPKRVPLYGIAKAPGTVVTVPYRINSGSSTPITINGKTWSSDDGYAFNNLQPFINPALSEITATDEDSLYFDEQSSNADKRPFKYELPLPDGDYVVRLHFAEVYWGTPGSGLTGGRGSRIMSVTMENKIRLINYDIVGDVGVASAVIKNIPVTVADGKLTIDFSATVNRPSLSALEVYKFTSSGPLAVRFLNFEGSVDDKKVNLDWTTGKEANTDHYEVERSTNNVDFTTIGSVPATNSSQENTYHFTDEDPQVGNNYYRIKEVDSDGRFTYSEVIRINYPNTLQMQVFPNPATNNIQIQLSGVQADQQATLSIRNIMGSVVKRLPVTLSNQKIDVNISSLSSGTYILSIYGNQFVINKKFVKYNHR